MAQTVIGIFKSSADAQNARQHLMDKGFTDDRIDISRQSETDYSDERHSAKDQGVGERIQRFFRNLFSDEEEIARYTAAASRGTVVTVHALTRVESVAAAGIMDDYGAVDVDEYAAATRSTTGASTGTGPVEKDVSRMSVTDSTFDSGRVTSASTGSGIGDTEAMPDRSQTNINAGPDADVTNRSMDPDRMTGADRRENSGAYAGPDGDFQNMSGDRPGGMKTDYDPSGMDTDANRMSKQGDIPYPDTDMNAGLRAMRADEKRSRSRIVERQLEENSRLREERMRADDSAGFLEVDEKQRAVRESLKSTEVNRDDLKASGDRKDDDRERHIHGEDVHGQRPGIV